jgi:hypothetical protein
MSTKAKIFVALGVTAAFVVGMGAGAAAGPADNTAATIHSPTTTVTQTAPRTPQSCLDALNAAERIINDAGDFAQTVVQMSQNSHRAVIAAYNHDVAAMTSVVSDIESNTAEIKSETRSVGRDGAEYRPAAADCRAAKP